MWPSEGITNVIDSNVPKYGYMFLPDGGKVTHDLTGESLVHEAGRARWTFLRLLDQTFHWKFGVCRNTVYCNEYLRGSRFSNYIQIVASFPQR